MLVQAPRDTLQTSSEGGVILFVLSILILIPTIWDVAIHTNAESLEHCSALRLHGTVGQ